MKEQFGKRTEEYLSWKNKLEEENDLLKSRIDSS